MEYGICHISIVPCRKEPADSSEMISQILFGEHFKVLERRKKWSLVRTALDNYESWIDNKQYQLIDKQIFDSLSKNPMCCTTDLAWSALREDNQHFPILLGSSLPEFQDGTFKIAGLQYTYDGGVSQQTGKVNRQKLVDTAFRYLNAPYMWGGRSPFGIDCSGFTQMVYKMHNKKLPRDAYQQAELGDGLSFIEEAEQGDLAFFDNEEGRIIHVGIVLPNHYILHASGAVRIDRLDHQGIHNKDLRTYSHHLRIIKRIL